MRIDPQIAALRGEPALQRRAQSSMLAAKASWQADAGAAAVLGENRLYGKGRPLEQLAELSTLVRDLQSASNFVQLWSDNFTTAVQESPLGLAPFGHSYAPGLATMRLAASGHAVISVLVYEEIDETSPVTSAQFVDREQIEIVLAGTAQATICQLRGGEPGPVATRDMALEPGVTLTSSGPQRTRQIRQVKGSLAILQLSRAVPNPQPSREIRLADGALIRQSCGDKRVSQDEMALALLGAMGRRDAAPLIAAMSREGPSHLRWEALRQALHLDPKLGFDALSHVAGSVRDELGGAAEALRESLVQRYPQLAQ